MMNTGLKKVLSVGKCFIKTLISSQNSIDLLKQPINEFFRLVTKTQEKDSRFDKFRHAKSEK